MYFQNSSNGSIEFYYDMITNSKNGEPYGIWTDKSYNRTWYFEKFSVAKDWKQFCQKTLSEFLDNSLKILRLVRNTVFLQIHEKVFL